MEKRYMENIIQFPVPPRLSRADFMVLDLHDNFKLPGIYENLCKTPF